VNKPKYSKEEVYTEILRIYKIENNMNKNIFKTYTTFEISDYNNFFTKYGGIKKICKELNIKNKPSKNTKKELLDAGKEAYEKYGYLTCELFEKKTKYSKTGIKGLFGSFTNFLNELNIPLNIASKITPEEVKEDVYNFCIKNHTTNSSLYRKYGKYNQCHIDKNFGGWINLLKELGLTPQKVKPGIDYMLSEVKKIYMKYNFISSKLINEECDFTYQAFSAYYDSIEDISLAVSDGKSKYIFNNSWMSVDIRKILSHLYKYIDKDKISIEKTFDWLITEEGTHMRLDIYIEDKNLCIEYNGKQHYEYIPFFHKDKEAFKRSQKRDQLKKELLKQHNIKLVQIKYDTEITEELIKEIIKN
jgi:hypothetical protein